MMEKFTKSPWVIGVTTDNAPFCVDARCNKDGAKFEVCSVWGSYVDTEPCEQSQANAALIAVAPEMYEMLKSFVDEGKIFFDEDYKPVIALLAKARGEK